MEEKDNITDEIEKTPSIKQINNDMKQVAKDLEPSWDESVILKKKPGRPRKTEAEKALTKKLWNEKHHTHRMGRPPKRGRPKKGYKKKKKEKKKEEIQEEPIITGEEKESTVAVEENEFAEVKQEEPAEDTKEEVDTSEEIVSNDTDEEPSVRYYGRGSRLKNMTKEERIENASNAGKQSWAGRRRNADLRRLTQEFLNSSANPQLRANMAALGMDVEQMTNLAALVTRIFTKVIAQGDLNAARTLIEWAGMAPLQQEKENQEIAKMAQMVALASPEKKEESEDDIVFYIPDNGRELSTNDGYVYQPLEESASVNTQNEDIIVSEEN